MGNGYLAEAKAFLDEAIAEFQQGEESNNLIIMKDACEKAWGGVIQALNALFNWKRPFAYTEEP